MAQNTQSVINSWTGGTPGARTPLVKGNEEFLKKVPFFNFGDIVSGATHQSIEAILGLQVKNEDGSAFSPITNTKNNKARIYKIHGTMPEGLSLKAGVNTGYPTAGPSPADTPSADATNNIPNDPLEALKMEFNPTDEEFQFLCLQLDALATTSPYVQKMQPGWSGYPIIRMEYGIEDKNYYLAPEGDKSDESYSHSKTEFFVKTEHGLQFIGSLLNQMDIEELLETVDAVKGMPAGIVSKDITKTGITINGNSYGHGIWLAKALSHGFYDGSDSWFKKITQSNAFRTIEYVPVYLHVRFKTGRDFWLHIPEAMLTYNGSYNEGTDEYRQIPFKVEAMGGGAYEKWYSEPLINSVDFSFAYNLIV